MDFQITSYLRQDMFDEEGNLIPIHKLPREVAYGIAWVRVLEEKRIIQTDPDSDKTEITQTSILDVKMVDKIRSTELLGKAFGVFMKDAEAPEVKSLTFDEVDPRDFARRVAFALRDRKKVACN
jgi:hypothetical protein